MKTLYEQLGITPQASQTAIQQSFFRLARKYDPNNPANQGNAQAREQYLAVQIAFRTLSNPDARANYDRSFQKQSPMQRYKRPGAAQKTASAVKS
ncbi:J domain-containing protein [bacterium]|nr:MAG: J domain-containing protein [bacterium]